MAHQRRNPECLYYHATGGTLPVGSVLQSHRTTRSGLFEAKVDALRPRGAPSRAESFFLGSHPADLLALGARTIKNIYNVQPIGAFLKADASWVISAAEVWDEIERTEEFGPQSRRMIENFWAGKRSPWFDGWETIAPRIRVCSKLTDEQRKSVTLETERRHPGFANQRILGRMFRGDMRNRAAIAADLGVDARLPSELEQSRRKRKRQS